MSPTRTPWPLRIVHASTILFALSAASSTAGAQIAVALGVLGYLFLVVAPGDPAGPRRAALAGLRFPLAGPLAAFLLAGALTGAFAVDRARALVELGGDWFFAAFFLVCVNALTPRRRLTARVQLLIGAGALAALYAVSQVLTHGLNYRVHGFLGHFNTLGGVLSLLALLALAVSIYRFRGPGDLWIAAACVLLLVALTLTQSRGAIGGFLLGAAILLGCRDRRLLLLIPVLTAAVLLVAPGDLRARVTGILDLSDITARERVYMWSAGAAMWVAHPVLGIGPGGTPGHYAEFQRPDDPWVQPEPPRQLHNNLVHLAAERGLLGTVPWIWLWLAFFRRTYDIYRRLPPGDPGGRALVLGSLACAATFLLTGMADYNHGDAEVVLLMSFTMALPFAADADPLGTTGTMSP